MLAPTMVWRRGGCIVGKGTEDGAGAITGDGMEADIGARRRDIEAVEGSSRGRDT